MKKTAKKLFCVFLSALLVCQLCTGCQNANAPEDTVKQFCDALQAMDFDKMSSYLSDDAAETLKELVNVADSVSGLISAILSALAAEYSAAEFVRLCAQNIRFEVSSRPSLWRKTTQVSVKFSYPDLLALLSAYSDKYDISSIEIALNGGIDFINGIWKAFADRPAIPETAKKTAPDLLKWANTQLRDGQCASVNIDITFECARIDRQWSISAVEPLDSLRDMLSFGFTV